MTKRRQFLKGIASSALLGSVHTATAQSSSDTAVQPLGTGDAGNDEELPVYADGRLVSHYRSDPSSEAQYILERTFESIDIAERYGVPAFRFRDVTLHEQMVPEEVRTGQRATYTNEDQLVVGTDSEHRTAESRIWKQESNNISTLDVPNIEDTELPLFHYDPNASGSGMEVRSSPMNLAWETDYASQIQAVMQAEGWNITFQLMDEYTVDKTIKLPNGSTKSTDEHVTKGNGNPIPSDQTHVRLYNVPIDGVSCIGQAHIDPWDHGKLEVEYGDGAEDVDYEIDSAGNEVADFWSNEDGHSIDSDDVGNTHTPEFGSFSGTWKIIEGSY
ncbi:hypothetical protein [Halomicrobium sp. LC1Hm]|uniref:hypothetical protein n=1 Tax=Halomicrobium sp. LC1Hm TaxID=2610902 RepID=UPI00129853CE|nr:hypothetical protein [Halomicrobium sp. LC1Hm]QGA84332.1 Uncharacterized protein LC1Hm_3315 [Halomicrobium sp. LC1Hm]